MTRKRTIILSLGIVALIAFFMWGMPQYLVYSAGMTGKAQLRKSTFNRQVKVQEAKADYEAAIWHLQRDTVQAYGIARSNVIIGNSLIKNEPYLVFRWIENLKEISGKGQVIYTTGMTPMPITEAYRLQQSAEAQEKTLPEN